MTFRSTALVALVLFAGWPLRSVAGVTPLERDELLDVHDAVRCAVDPPAASMPALVWDATLASVAQAYANGCVFQHNGNRTTQYAAAGGSGSVGENLALGTASAFSLADFAQLWANEEALWSYGTVTNANVGAVGHYTQMIWATTTAVGCGAAACASNTLLVCNYTPTGNFLNQTPYVAGAGTNLACPEPGTALGLVGALAALAALRSVRRAGDA